MRLGRLDRIVIGTMFLKIWSEVEEHTSNPLLSLILSPLVEEPITFSKGDYRVAKGIITLKLCKFSEIENCWTINALGFDIKAKHDAHSNKWLFRAEKSDERGLAVYDEIIAAANEIIDQENARWY